MGRAGKNAGEEIRHGSSYVKLTEPWESLGLTGRLQIPYSSYTIPSPS